MSPVTQYTILCQKKPHNSYKRISSADAMDFFFEEMLFCHQNTNIPHSLTRSILIKPRTLASSVFPGSKTLLNLSDRMENIDHLTKLAFLKGLDPF